MRSKMRDLQIVYTPGNHDIGDQPTKSWMDAYKKHWSTEMFQDISTNPEFERYAKKGTLAMEINSQLYQDSSGTGADAEKAFQNKQINAFLAKMNKHTKTIVFITHIPPFMDDLDKEKEG